MKDFFEKLRVEDWVVVWVSIPLLLLAALFPAAMPRVPSTLVGEVAWYNIALLFVIVLAVLYVGCLLLRRPLKGLLPSLAVVFAVSLLAQVVAKIPIVAYYGFESVFFSVLFGLLIRNVWHVPAWMKPAIQGEFFIKIGVVCLGATILFSDVMKSGVFGLLQAILVVAVVWFFAFRVSRRWKVDERSAMILSSGVSICGVSACITAARVAGGDDRKLSYIVSLVLIVVVAYGRILPRDILDCPPLGCVNIHGSLLPKYRGAAPIQWTVLNGDPMAGVTSMYMAEGMDTGDMILTMETPVGENETSGELFDRLMELGAECLSRTMKLFEEGSVPRRPQREEEATLAPMLDKAMGQLKNFDRDARDIHNLIRGLNPWPSVVIPAANGKKLKLHHSLVVPGSGKPGEILDSKKLVVACARGALELTQVQPEGKGRMTGGEFMRGARLTKGDNLFRGE